MLFDVKNKKILYLTLSGVFSALVFVLTAYLHIPVHTGYVHVGDGVLYLSACLLPLPYAVFPGACGALLSDCLTGFAVWAPGSVPIKVFSALCFSRKGQKIVCRRNLLALIPASALCVGGYYLYECLITGNFLSPLAGIPGNLVQAGLSAALFLLFGLASDRMDLKRRLPGEDG